MFNEDYVKRLLKRINERRAKYNLLVSKKKLLEETKEEIDILEQDISNLDNRICVLTS